MTSNALRAYFYLLEGEKMPNDAEDSWFLGKDPAIRPVEEVETFQSHALALLDDIAPLETEDDIQAAFYARAKLAYGEDKASIRKFFVLLYLLLFFSDSGPRWGQFVVLTGKEQFCSLVRTKLANPLM